MTCYMLAGVAPDIGEGAYVAPGAHVIGRVTLGVRTSVWFGAVLRGDTETIAVGAESNIQDGAMIHADPGAPTIIGSGVTVGHHAIVHGATIGDNSLIGIGATLLNGAVIGPDSLVGAHALVTEGKTFPAGSLIVGVPARVIRPLSEAEIAGLRLSAATYVANGRRFAADLTAL